MDADDLRHALGGVVLEAAYLERVLRAAFSALIGSKYASLVDSRLTVAHLIEDCERITRRHTDIPAPAQNALLNALKACHEANLDRNRVIHESWATRPGNVLVTMHGSSHEVTVTMRTAAEVQRVANRVADAADDIQAAMTAALGSGWIVVEDQLRQELGHDLSADPGA